MNHESKRQLLNHQSIMNKMVLTFETMDESWMNHHHPFVGTLGDPSHPPSSKARGPAAPFRSSTKPRNWSTNGWSPGSTSVTGQCPTRSANHGGVPVWLSRGGFVRGVIHQGVIDSWITNIRR